MPDIEDCHEWMFKVDEYGDFLAVLLDLRRGVEDLNATAGSFRLGAVLDDHHTTVVRDEMIHLMGSWELPARLSGEGAKRFVNPNYVHKHVYADIVVRCECGALVGREWTVSTWRGKWEHTEDCETEWRKDARQRLREKREEWIREAADLYLTAEEVAPRMSVEQCALAGICKRYDIDWMDRKLEGRQKTINTWAELHDEYGHTYADIAEAFGRPPTTVRTYVRGNGEGVDGAE